MKNLNLLKHESNSSHYSKTKCIERWRNTYRTDSWRLWTCACWFRTASRASAWTSWFISTSGRSCSRALKGGKGRLVRMWINTNGEKKLTVGAAANRSVEWKVWQFDEAGTRGVYGGGPFNVWGIDQVEAKKNNNDLNTNHGNKTKKKKDGRNLNTYWRHWHYKHQRHLVVHLHMM